MSVRRLSEADCLEMSDFHYVAEGRALGIPRNDFPERIETDLGNAKPFVRGLIVVDEDEVTGCRYVQADGCTSLLVLND